MDKIKNLKYSSRNILKRVYHFVKPYKLDLTIYFILSIIGTFISVVFASIINKSVSSSLHWNQSLLIKCIVEAVIVALAGIVATYYATYLFGLFTSKVMRDIRNESVNRLLNLQVKYLEDSQMGDLISRLTKDMRTLQNFISNDLFGTLISMISVIVVSVYMISISYKLYIITFVSLPPALYLSTFVLKPMRKYFRESSINVGKANSVAYDAYEGISIIKSFNIQNLFYKRFTDFIDISYLNRVKAAGRLKFIPVFNIIIWLFPYITCLIYGSYLTINKEISIGQLLAFFYLINNIVGPVSSTPNIYSSVRNSMGTAQRFFEILDGPAERSGGSNFDIHGSEMCARFKYVSFSYDGDEVNRKEILHNLCFDLKKGSKTALVGKSGCGKSTTLKLLMGYYDNFQGEIELFGRNIKDWSIEGIRSKISYVSQDTFLFPLSIYENIRLGKTNATRVEVEKAAKYANAHEFIMQFPNGYDTEVGERGIRLSGGQKQRISLARAFLRNAPIIILDEPTSALDNQSESLVMEAVHRLISDRSLIVVTHRLSFIKDADNILVLDNGKIAESGTHEQLISKGNLYSELYNRQINQTSAID